MKVFYFLFFILLLFPTLIFSSNFDSYLSVEGDNFVYDQSSWPKSFDDLNLHTLNLQDGTLKAVYTNQKLESLGARREIKLSILGVNEINDSLLFVNYSGYQLLLFSDNSFSWFGDEGVFVTVNSEYYFTEEGNGFTLYDLIVEWSDVYEGDSEQVIYDVYSFRYGMSSSVIESYFANDEFLFSALDEFGYDDNLMRNVLGENLVRSNGFEIGEDNRVYVDDLSDVGDSDKDLTLSGGGFSFLRIFNFFSSVYFKISLSVISFVGFFYLLFVFLFPKIKLRIKGFKDAKGPKNFNGPKNSNEDKVFKDSDGSGGLNELKKLKKVKKLKVLKWSKKSNKSKKSKELTEFSDIESIKNNEDSFLDPNFLNIKNYVINYKGYYSKSDLEAKLLVSGYDSKDIKKVFDVVFSK